MSLGRIVLLVVGVALLAGCGQSGLSEGEIKQALEKTPLTYRYKDERYSGDGAAVGGTATNGRATVTFEIVFGEPTIENPIFPQDRNDIDRFQRSSGDDYTVTFNLPRTLEAGKRQARVANTVEGAMCDRMNDCGGPAG